MMRGTVVITKRRFAYMLVAFLILAGATAWAIAQEHRDSQAARRALAGQTYSTLVQQCYVGNKSRTDSNSFNNDLNTFITNTDTLFQVVQKLPELPEGLSDTIDGAVTANEKALAVDATQPIKDCPKIYSSIRPKGWPIPVDPYR